jgi:hypothetical protein
LCKVTNKIPTDFVPRHLQNNAHLFFEQFQSRGKSSGSDALQYPMVKAFSSNLDRGCCPRSGDFLRRRHCKGGTERRSLRYQSVPARALEKGAWAHAVCVVAFLFSRVAIPPSTGQHITAQAQHSTAQAGRVSNWLLVFVSYPGPLTILGAHHSNITKQHSIAQPIAAQPSTAQHGTAQHETQDSTAHHTTM